MVTNIDSGEEKPEVRVCFDLGTKDADGWPPVDSETLWATPVGQNTFTISNVPFYVMDVAFGDVVEAVADSQHSAVYNFVRVLTRSGHSTYRLYRYSKSDAVFQEWIDKLLKLGCTYESDKNLYAIDMDPTVDVSAAYKCLSDGAAMDVWDFEEGWYSDGQRD